MRLPSPPRSEAELIERAGALRGRTLSELAAYFEIPVPHRPAAAKGWAGQLVEFALGASAGSLPEPDFQLIGVELKTIPIRPDGRPAESTYVCMVPLHGEGPVQWRQSTVYQKLARVLWLPIEADPDVELPLRRIGPSVLWSPNKREEAALRTDWEELMDMVCLGQLEQVSAAMGTHLQLRPKARDASVRTAAIGPEGQTIRTNPRGFYLRPEFTHRILSQGRVERPQPLPPRS